MVWYNLKVGNWNLKLTPINPLRTEYPYCDSKGQALVKIAGKFERGHYLNEATSEKHDTAFRLIKGKPFAKLTKTKEVGTFKEVDTKEVEDLIIEKQYLVECDPLLDELKTTKKALKFGYSSGNGFKVYKAYVYPSIYEGFLEMSLGTTQKSEVVMGIVDIQKQSQKAKKMEITIQGIDRAKVEDLIEI